MKITITEPKLPNSGALVVGVLKGGTLLATAKQLDKASKGALGKAIKASRFTGGKGQWLDLIAPAGIGADRVLLGGLGEAKKIKRGGLENFGGAALQRLATSGMKTVTIACDPVTGAKATLALGAASLAYGARLASYRFDKYRTKMKAKDKASVGAVTVLVKGASAARKEFRPLDAIADGVFMTRDLVSEPANVLYPESMAQACKTLAKLGVKVEVLNEARMAKLGMGALLGVGQGSRRESRLVVMRWQGGGAKIKPVAFVGKGVTFDTGGISLKPGPGMGMMKWDMGGAGAVIGLMKALAGRKAKANVVGVVGLVENMPDGNAQRPGDIVTSMSGQTIEILNTDAEGRLVLADALWYTQGRFKPQFMVNLATLTGAIITALGHEHAGLFSNDDKLSKQLSEAGEEVDEQVWRLPLSEAYDKLINCPIADMKNIGGPAAGSITAAQFLQRYVNKVPWAHLDIAGTAWADSGKPTVPKGGTGWGVRMLDRLVANHYEGGK
jgi:leucyl aminopeptidase